MNIHNEDIIKSLNKSVAMVSAQFTAMEDILEARMMEIEHLKSEHYKDDELKKMSEELAEARADLNRGFGISEKEQAAIAKWVKKHEAECHSNTDGFPRGGAIGGCYDYIFTPTSIGVVGEIKCNCGKSFTFQNLY